MWASQKAFERQTRVQPRDRIFICTRDRIVHRGSVHRARDRIIFIATRSRKGLDFHLHKGSDCAQGIGFSSREESDYFHCNTFAQGIGYYATDILTCILTCILMHVKIHPILACIARMVLHVKILIDAFWYHFQYHFQSYFTAQSLSRLSASISVHFWGISVNVCKFLTFL